jgi:hypothetical protein
MILKHWRDGGVVNRLVNIPSKRKYNRVRSGDPEGNTVLVHLCESNRLANDCSESNEARPVSTLNDVLPSFFCDSTFLVRTLVTPYTGGFFDLFKHSVGLFGLHKGLCLHRTTTQKNENIHALRGIRNHDLSVQAIKTYCSDSKANHVLHILRILHSLPFRIKF